MLDAGAGIAPFEVRHPFMDLRVLRFLLAVPPLPWCRSKYLVRRAMRGMLPDAVLRRQKSGIPLNSITRRAGRLGTQLIIPTRGFTDYVVPERVERVGSDDVESFGVALRARALNNWLQSMGDYRHNMPLEVGANETVPERAGRID